jgi:hypothetical protein
MISNLCLLFLAIAKLLLLTGLGPAIAIAILYECFGVRIVRVGIEKVSGARRLAWVQHRPAESLPAVRPSRKVARVA